MRGYRDWPFGATVRFRLLLKGSLMEFYLDDLLMRSQSLPQEATGHIGILPAGDPTAVTALKAWQTGQLQPAAKDEEQETPPQDDVYSRAAPGTYDIPPELKNFRIMSATPLQISNAEEAGYDIKYYKGDRGKAGVPTRNGVAIADALTGPYKKYENNPLLYGHGHFAWRYKHGIIMMMFDYGRKSDTRILWTEDGLHFVPLTEGEGTFVYGSLYCPYDPLFGKPVSEQPTTEYWGLETLVNSGATGMDVGRIEWKFGSDSAPEKEKIQ